MTMRWTYNVKPLWMNDNEMDLQRKAAVDDMTSNDNETDLQRKATVDE